MATAGVRCAGAGAGVTWDADAGRADADAAEESAAYEAAAVSWASACEIVASAEATGVYSGEA